MTITKRKRVVYCVVMTIVTTLALFIDINILESGEEVVSWVSLVTTSGYISKTICLACAVGLLFFYLWIFNGRSFKLHNLVFSLYLSCGVLLGKCYEDTIGLSLLFCSGYQVIKSLIILLGYMIFFYSLLEGLDDVAKVYSKKEEYCSLNKGYIIKGTAFVLLCWLPYFFIIYPGTLLYDTVVMIRQYFGLDVLTNHHSFYQVLLIGNAIKFGNYINGSPALGVAIYTIIQGSLYACVIVTMTKELIEHGMISFTVGKIVVALYALFPVFPIHALAIGKNQNHTLYLIALLLILYKVLNTNNVNSLRWLVLGGLLFGVIALVVIGRNEGVAIAFITCLLGGIVCKDKKVLFLAASIFSLIIFVVWYIIVIPLSGVKQGSKAEALSLPFLQIARYVHYYEQEMNDDELYAISKIISIEACRNYNKHDAEISDAIKNTYNNSATEKDISAFIKVYKAGFVKHPLVYIDAVFNKCYGYFDIDSEGLKPYYESGIKEGEGIGQINEALKYDLFARNPQMLKKMDAFLDSIKCIPVISLFTSCGIYTAILFWCCVRSVKKHIVNILLFTPGIIVVLVCIASPVNNYFRYELPVVFCSLFYICIALGESTNEE